MWVGASALARDIRSDLRPLQLPESPELLRHQVRRVAVEFADGLRHIVHTPRAVGPITSIGLDQVGQGLILVLALVVFRERFDQGVGSFSWLIGAGGVGVFAGLATVGALDRRFARERIVAGAFALGGVAILLVSLLVAPWTLLGTSFVVGLTFAWKKVPVDTMVQEAVPDGLRGRVFAAYDVVYNVARLTAALLAVPLLPAVGEQGAAAIVGIAFLLWVPVLPRWLARGAGDPAAVRRGRQGARSGRAPSSGAGSRNPSRSCGAALDERDGVRVRRFRLALADGTVLDVGREEPDGEWRIEREVV